MIRKKCVLIIFAILAFAVIYGGLMQNEKQEKMYVILTGGPGGGKSSVLEALRKRGYDCVDEVARDLIKDEVSINGDALPWKNMQKFRDKMFYKQLEVCQAVRHDGVVFFDRGLIDCVAYSRLINLEVSEEMDQISRSRAFHPIVFVTPPWEEIYQNDEERKQSFSEAVETYDQIVATYNEYDYQVIDLPKVDVEDRVNFILNKLGVQ